MNNIDVMSVNSIRVLAADAVQKAKSGHPGLPLGCAAVAYELWAKKMKHNPANPDWRFLNSRSSRISPYQRRRGNDRSSWSRYGNGSRNGDGRGTSSSKI